MDSTQNIIKKRLLNRAANNRVPVSGTFELTPRCNMNCKMCYIHSSEPDTKNAGHELTTEEWISLGKTCAENGMLFLLLTGGEPFIRPDFKTIYSELKKAGLCISVNTNGTMITDEDIAFLSKEKPEVINISLYGTSNETYEKLCGIKNGFDKVSKNIEKIKESGIPVILNVTLAKINLSDLKEIVSFGESRDIPLKITSYCFNPVRKCTTAADIDNVVFNEKESAYARFLTMKYLLHEERFSALRKSIINGDFSLPDFENENDIQGCGSSCMAGKSSFWITWDGKLLPCGMIPAISSDLKQNDFAHAWKDVVNKTDSISLPSSCSSCKAKKLCRPCAAIAYSENGNFSARPEYLCKSTEEYIRLMKNETV